MLVIFWLLIDAVTTEILQWPWQQ